MMNIYYIGGSPCSGKSTIAGILSKKYDLYYFKVDDFLNEYTQTGALKGYEICKKQVELTAEQIWMRCDEENFVSHINNGEMAINELVNIVSAHFELDT